MLTALQCSYRQVCPVNGGGRARDRGVSVARLDGLQTAWVSPLDGISGERGSRADRPGNVDPAFNHGNEHANVMSALEFTAGRDDDGLQRLLD
jgi:hypothetical protein